MATKTETRPLPFSLAYFQRLSLNVQEHYDDGSHEDREGNTPCEDDYCKANESDVAVLKAMFEAMGPLLWDYINDYDFTEHDSFSELRRTRKHRHECGQRMTGRAVVVEDA